MLSQYCPRYLRFTVRFGKGRVSLHFKSHPCYRHINFTSIRISYTVRTNVYSSFFLNWGHWGSCSEGDERKLQDKRKALPWRDLSLIDWIGTFIVSTPFPQQRAGFRFLPSNTFKKRVAEIIAYLQCSGSVPPAYLWEREREKQNHFQGKKIKIKNKKHCRSLTHW